MIKQVTVSVIALAAASFLFSQDKPKYPPVPDKAASKIKSLVIQQQFITARRTDAANAYTIADTQLKAVFADEDAANLAAIKEAGLDPESVTANVDVNGEVTFVEKIKPAPAKPTVTAVPAVEAPKKEEKK